MFPFDLNPRPRRGFALAGLATALAFMASGSFAQGPCPDPTGFIVDMLDADAAQASYDFTIIGTQDVFALSADGLFSGHLSQDPRGSSIWSVRGGVEPNETNVPIPNLAGGCADNNGDPRGLGAATATVAGGVNVTLSRIIFIEDLGTNMARVTDELTVVKTGAGVLALDVFHQFSPLVEFDGNDSYAFAGTEGPNTPKMAVFQDVNVGTIVGYGCADCEFAEISADPNTVYVGPAAGIQSYAAPTLPAGPPATYFAGYQWFSENFGFAAGEVHSYRVVYTVNAPVDFGTPLAVELESFNATTRGKRSPVSIAWTTSAEIDNLGFYVYRAERDNARSAWKMAEEPVNLTLIPSRGTPSRGADYRLMDVASRSGEVAYFLVDIDISGRETVHGPALLTIVNPGNTQAEVAGGPDAEAGNDSRLPNALNNGRATR